MDLKVNVAAGNMGTPSTVESICALNFGNFMHELEMRWERFNEMPAKGANPKRPLEP